MRNMKIDILGLNEIRCFGNGVLNGDKFKIIYV